MRFLAIVPFATLFALPALSAPLGEGSNESTTKRSDFSTTLELDDAPATGVTYSGNWTHLTNQGFELSNKTESYTSEANAEARFDAPEATYGITSVTIYSTKKADRGDFSVYCGTGLVGTGNENSSGEETDTQIVFEAEVTTKCVLADGDRPYIIIKNDKGADFIAVDKVEINYVAE